MRLLFGDDFFKTGYQISIFEGSVFYKCRGIEEKRDGLFMLRLFATHCGFTVRQQLLGFFVVPAQPVSRVYMLYPGARILLHDPCRVIARIIMIDLLHGR